MNDKDKEAFDEYISWLSDYYFGNDDRRTHDIKVWKAACDYKEDEFVNRLAKSYMEGMKTGRLSREAENKKLREALDRIDNSNDDMKYFNSDIHIIIHETRESLKEVEE